MSTAFVVGASRGIGLSLTRAYLRRGYKVIATCRERSHNFKSVGAQWIHGFDVTSLESIEAGCASIPNVRFDVFIYNAGILYSDDLDSLDITQVEQQFDVNSLGIIRVVKTFRDNLNNNGKLVIISSEMGSISDLDHGGDYGYRMSKAASNMAVACLAKDLYSSGISVVALHPGRVKTRMTKFEGEWSAEAAGDRIFDLVSKFNISETGLFLDCDKRVLPW